MKNYYFFRNETIERCGLIKGWTWMEETCRGNNTSPVYKTIEDTKNAIRKYLDSTHKAEPRIVGYIKWNGNSWEK